MPPLSELPSPSLWNATAAPAPATTSLTSSLRTDILVVGGGYTGLSTALHLAENGAEVAVLEAQALGHGGSGRNMGQVNAGFLVRPLDVIRHVGPALGERMNATFADSTGLVYDIIARYAIDCDLVRKGNLFLAHDRRSLNLVRAFHDQHLTTGAPMEWLERDAVGSLVGSATYTAGVLDHRAGNVQPLSYARGLGRAAIEAGAMVHTRTRVTGLSRTQGRWQAETESGAAVTAEQIVLATDSYSDSLWDGLARTLVPIIAQQVATEPLGENVGRTILDDGQATADRMRFVHYFKKDRDGRLIMLVGGPAPPAPELLKRFFPQLDKVRFQYHWTGAVGLSRDHLPHLCRPAPGITAVMGYSGRGLTAGTMVGKLLAESLLGNQPEPPIPIQPLKPRRFWKLQTAAMSFALSAASKVDTLLMRRR